LSCVECEIGCHGCGEVGNIVDGDAWVRLAESLWWIKGVRGIYRDVPLGLAWPRASVVLAKSAAREVFFLFCRLSSYAHCIRTIFISTSRYTYACMSAKVGD
jgi:hypothetical protein